MKHEKTKLHSSASVVRLEVRPPRVPVLGGGFRFRKANLQNSRQQIQLKSLPNNAQNCTTISSYATGQSRSGERVDPSEEAEARDRKSLEREAMLTGQGSDWLWDQWYFRPANFLQNLKSGGFQFEYWRIDLIRDISS